MATLSVPPKKCPVCGSPNLKQRQKDGISSYVCDQGHVFIVQKTGLSQDAA